MNMYIKKYLMMGLALAMTTAALPAGRASARLQRIQEHRCAVRPVVKQASMAPCVGATRAYLSNPMLTGKVRQEFATSIAKYKSIVHPILLLEERHEKTHTPLYHGDPGQLRVYQDLLKLIYTWHFKKPVRDDFIFLRWWERASQHADVNAFCDANPMEHGVGKHNDSKKEVGNQILSVNFTLFGNTVKNGESTWRYFTENRSCWITGDTLLGELLKDIFAFYKFDPQYIKEIQALAQEIATQEGSALQLLMPSTAEDNTLDKYVYLVGPDKLYGMPRDSHYVDMDKKPIAAGDFDAAKKRYVRSSGVLKYRVENAQALKNVTFDGIQGRLLLNKDVLTPDGNSIKMYRYTTVSPDKMRAYQEKLDALFKKMVAGKEDADGKEEKAKAARAAIAAPTAVIVSKL